MTKKTKELPYIGPSIGEQITNALETRGITINEAATHSGISWKTIHKICKDGKYKKSTLFKFLNNMQESGYTLEIHTNQITFSDLMETHDGNFEDARKTKEERISIDTPDEELQEIASEASNIMERALKLMAQKRGKKSSDYTNEGFSLIDANISASLMWRGAMG